MEQKMANVSKANLTDKIIRELEPKEKQYRKAVGNPKELYIMINPSGIKTFFVLFNQKAYKLERFEQGKYGIEQAREDAFKKVKWLKDNPELKQNKYNFGVLYSRYIRTKKLKLAPSYTIKIESQMQKYILPRFANIDIAKIKFSDILEVLEPLFNPYNPKKSHLETIHRLINYIGEIFDLANYDRYIDYNPRKALHKQFPTSSSFNTKNGIDTRYQALTNEVELREFLTDLRDDNKMDLQTKRALKLHILCVNRPMNTVSAKWEHINLENGIWSIPANEMKMGFSHQIALPTQAIRILKEQKLYCPIESKFIFPTFSQDGHLHRDSMGKAIRNLGGNGKYSNKATAHGFRATFKTICSINEAELLSLGIGEKAVENALAHKERNNVKFAYERQMATIEQNRALMQWYANYLCNIVDFI